MAKRKKKSGDDTSKSKSITFVKKKKRSTPRRNPDGDSVALLVTDLAAQAIPVVVTFAGTHVLAHVVGDRLLAGKSWAKHVKVLTALSAIVGVYFAGRSKALEKYQTGAMIGATLATLQTVFQAYVPQIAWILGTSPSYVPMLAAPAQTTAPKAQAGLGEVGDDEDESSDDLSDLQGIFAGGATGSGWTV